VLDASTVESNLYSPCSASTEVELLKVIGGGHTWPGTSSLLGGVGTINRDINASGEIWNFFRNRSCGSAPTSVASIPTTSLGIDKVDPNRYLLKSGTGSGFSYDVYDLSGRMVMNGQGNDGDIIDLSSVASGPYVLVLRSGVEVADFRIFR
jgi:polyhydroxybutyrate depolymerase